MIEGLCVGSKVRLKSGGPAMTVVKVVRYMRFTKCTCTWFNTKNELLTDVFPVDALESA